MTLRNLHNAFTGYQAAEARRYRGLMVAQRFGAWLTIQAWGGKAKTPQDVIVFEWEKDQDWYKEKYKPYTPQEKESIVDFYQRRKDRRFYYGNSG